jgi:hypothetical protein
MEVLHVGVLEEDEVYRRGVMAVLNEDDCVCIVLGGGRETSPEAADAEDSLDVAVVCSRVLDRVRLSCPLVCLAIPRPPRRGELSFVAERQGDAAPRRPDGRGARRERSRRCSRAAGRVAEPEPAER